MDIFFYVTISALALLVAIHYILKKIWPVKTFSYQIERILKEKGPEQFELFKEISKESGYTMEALLYTHYALVLDKEDDSVNTPDRTCENFLELFNLLYTESPSKGIMTLQIKSSKDLGMIAFELNERGIIKMPPKVKLSDFDDQFEQI